MIRDRIAAVQRIETVTIESLMQEPGEPIWRIEIGGYCADFDYQAAAENFAGAINGAAVALVEDAVAGERERCRKIALAKTSPGPCSHVGFACPETGVRECAREQAGEECICDTKSEMGDEIATAIREGGAVAGQSDNAERLLDFALETLRMRARGVPIHLPMRYSDKRLILSAMLDFATAIRKGPDDE